MSLVTIDEAIKKLSNSEIVALPTETVYGLAGLISDESALKKIFSLKKRPFYDPLIVHVTNSKQAKEYGHFQPMETLLADFFWPGPLTIVVPKKENISDLITNGGPTVAFRSPDHEAFQTILSQLSTPLAAPSANLFGQTSPTDTHHVFSELGKELAVVDGGVCQQGIESTVIQVDNKNKLIKILRPGVIGPGDLKSFLESNNFNYTVDYSTQINSPGFLKNHYQPKAPFLFIPTPLNAEDLNKIIFDFNKLTKQKAIEWRLSNSPALAARNLYGEIREFSDKNQSFYLMAKKEWNENELWTSLTDRLSKASHFQIKKSQGLLGLQNKLQ